MTYFQIERQTVLGRFSAMHLPCLKQMKIILSDPPHFRLPFFSHLTLGSVRTGVAAAAAAAWVRAVAGAGARVGGSLHVAVAAAVDECAAGGRGGQRGRTRRGAAGGKQRVEKIC